MTKGRCPEFRLCLMLVVLRTRERSHCLSKLESFPLEFCTISKKITAHARSKCVVAYLQAVAKWPTGLLAR